MLLWKRWSAVGVCLLFYHANEVSAKQIPASLLLWFEKYFLLLPILLILFIFVPLNAPMSTGLALHERDAHRFLLPIAVLLNDVRCDFAIDAVIYIN